MLVILSFVLFLFHLFVDRRNIQHKQIIVSVSYQNIAGQSIFEIGRRLKHVKENDLAHGEWSNWLKSVNFNDSQARKFIKVSDEFQERSMSNTLGIEALYQIASSFSEEDFKRYSARLGHKKTLLLTTMTDEQKEQSLNEGVPTDQGYKTYGKATQKEIAEYKRNSEEMERKAKEYEQQLKQRDEEKSQLESQLEQSQRSESIARKQLEEAEDRDPEVIEKYMEPEDYQSIKNMNEHLQSEREYYKKQADDFRNEVRDIMNQPNETTEFTGKDDNKDYTPIFIHLLKPVEKFIDHYNHHINKENALNEIEKIKKILKEQ